MCKPSKADTAESLLREALEYLNDRPAFSLRRDPYSTSYHLAARIDAYFRKERRVAAFLAEERGQ